jgi:hypothetical protein
LKFVLAHFEDQSMNAIVSRRGGRKRAIGTRAPMTVPMAPKDRCSRDFVFVSYNGSELTIFGLPRSIIGRSRAARTPESEVSATSDAIL